MKKLNSSRALVLALVTLIGLAILTGCNDDKRVAEVALEGSQRQATQNEEMAHVVQTGAETTTRLIALQHDLDRQRAELEIERRSQADQRRQESVIGPLITAAGWLFVAALPLILCWYLLHGLGRDNLDIEIGHLLIEEIVAAEPTLLPPAHDDTARETPSSSALTVGVDSQRETPN